MKLRTAVIAALFAAVMAGLQQCPCGGINGGSDLVPGAETFYCGPGQPW